MSFAKHPVKDTWRRVVILQFWVPGHPP